MNAVTAKEKDFSKFINDMIQIKVLRDGLPYCYASEDIAQEVMLGLWKSFGKRWIISDHKKYYYSFILQMARNQAVTAKRKVFGRRLGERRKFEYGIPEDNLDEQSTHAAPEFYAALMQALDQATRKNARYAGIADRMVMDPGRNYEIAKGLGVGPTRAGQIGSIVRQSVVEATT